VHQLCRHFLQPDLLSLLASELAEVAILAQAQRVVRLLSVFTVVRQLCAPVAVVARLAESFRVEWLVCVRAGVDLLRFALLFLNRLLQALLDVLHVGILGGIDKLLYLSIRLGLEFIFFLLFV